MTKYIEKRSRIINDKYTKYIYEAFDIQDTKETITKIPSNFSEIEKFEWNIGVIYGGSGSGKTTLLKEFGEITEHNFSFDKPLISNFDWLEPKEACLLLSAMGLSSVPSWLRPFSILSNGEQYRASLAYKVGKAKNGETILIDEFTSVVDRDVAKAMSFALQKYIRKTNKKIILASCHFDIMEWLLPDWIYSPLKGRLEKASCLRQRPKIKLQIFRCRYEAWDLFKQHHYLSPNLNKSTKGFIALWNNKAIAFIGMLAMIGSFKVPAYRVTRLVVLPDFQGLGIGMQLLNMFGAMYKKDNKTLYIKTSNPSLYKSMENNTLLWKKIKETNNINTIKSINKFRDTQKGILEDKYFRYKQSISKSYKYVGGEYDKDIDILIFNANAYKNVSQKQVRIF